MSAAEVRALFANALKVAVVHAEIGMAVYATVPGGPLYTEFVGAFADAKISYRAQLTWVKQQFVIGRSDYHYRHEPILYGWLENGAHYWNGDRSQDSVFEVDKPHVSAEHPTQKPIALISKMIANSTRPGELVYDCFAGSGSTLVAAHQLGRVSYGVEISPEYLAVALQRLADLGLEPKLIDG
jgi:DNA modification methylase